MKCSTKDGENILVIILMKNKDTLQVKHHESDETFCLLGGYISL